MKILLTNDDGIKAEGIRALYRALPKSVEVFVVAPSGARSASGHSISLEHNIHVKELKWENGANVYAVDGTPVDCVKFAIAKLKCRPDLLLSGVNLGSNTGISVFYSGTVAAAREGLFSGIPAIAVSMAGSDCLSYEPATDMVSSLIERYTKSPIPLDLMLNINVPVVPKRELKGVKITRQAPSRFEEEFDVEEAAGKTSYRLKGFIELVEPDGTSDEEAVKQGFISITPLHVDLTAYHGIEFLKRWYAKPLNGKSNAKSIQNTFKLY